MENTKMSGKLAKGMTLTVDDQTYIKRLFDREEEISLNHSMKVVETVESLINKQTEKFEKRFDEIDLRLYNIELNLSDKEKRLQYLEKYASWPHTVLRHAIAIGVGISLGWWLHSLFSVLLHGTI